MRLELRDQGLTRRPLVTLQYQMFAGEAEHTGESGLQIEAVEGDPPKAGATSDEPLQHRRSES
jgi:hypothetical protein